jgi:hypothetical protein
MIAVYLLALAWVISTYAVCISDFFTADFQGIGVADFTAEKEKPRTFGAAA